MNEGVEWAAHCCLFLDWLGEGLPLDDRTPVPTTRLAAAFEVPAPYLNKQLQALAKAGILASVAGKRGGFRLARPLDRITMMDIVTAVEGPEDAFSCTEIRGRGVGAGSPPRRKPCDIAATMRAAELAWRRSLAAQSLAGIKASVEAHSPLIGDHTRRWYEQKG